VDVDIAQMRRQSGAVPVGQAARGRLIQGRQHSAINLIIVAARTPGSRSVPERSQPVGGEAPPDLAHRTGAHVKSPGDRLGTVPGARPQQDVNAQPLQLTGAMAPDSLSQVLALRFTQINRGGRIGACPIPGYHAFFSM
jgi:hypothetical protein